MTKDDLLRQLQSEIARLDESIQSLRAKRRDAAHRVAWLASPFRYGDLVEVAGAHESKRVVVTYASDGFCSGRVVGPSGLTKETEFIPSSSKVIGRYEGNDLPAKLDAAVWAETILDGSHDQG